MIDMSKPEIKQAYLMGVEAGKTITAGDADRAAQNTENRIVYELDLYRSKLEKHDCVVQAAVVTRCLALIQGEVVKHD
jgi:hypothetical protein